MHVALLRAENLRLYKSIDVALHPRLNLLVGANASGKTTFLESLFSLSRGRSFRGNSLAELNGPEKAAWWVHARMDKATGPVSLGLGWNRSETRIRVAEREARVADLARAMPAQLIEPGQHRLLEEGPAYRRSYIDWGVFHVEHDFFETWRRFQRALKQRNRALRLRQPLKAVSAWDRELAEAGESVSRFRQTHLQEVEPQLRVKCEVLFGSGALSWEFHRGWKGGVDLLEVLAENGARHLETGTTGEGPHRAELRIRLNSQAAKNQVSRGQQKLAIAAMVLAQCETIRMHTGEAPIVLIDDFAAELSADFQARLAAVLQMYEGQVFVTAFEVPPALAGFDKTLFHVEQGHIKQAA